MPIIFYVLEYADFSMKCPSSGPLSIQYLFCMHDTMVLMYIILMICSIRSHEVSSIILITLQFPNYSYNGFSIQFGTID